MRNRSSAIAVVDKIHRWMVKLVGKALEQKRFTQSQSFSPKRRVNYNSRDSN